LTTPRTPSQTIGPYLSLAMGWPSDGPYVVAEGTPSAIWIRGRLLDGAGMPVGDGVVETWQPDPEGRFPTSADASFRGFGRAMSDVDGRWAVHTVKPGRILDPQGGGAAPHVSVAVFARGLLKPVWTRIYFGDEVDANEADDLLRSVEASRRTTLMAEPTIDGYQFDVRLQGPGETVFFDV
jgi:protocatechuate 3,4-dioxygenase, alpha subunit